MPNRPRVLHVTESFGGGTAAALIEFARSTPDYEHHLVYATRAGSEISVPRDVFGSSRTSARSPFALRRAMRTARRELDPSIVHLHSSWAGMVGRAGMRRPAAAVAYSPHCFAFDRLDVPAVARGAIRLAERMLTLRTDLVIAVSPDEERQALTLGARACFVANTSRRTAERDANPDDVTVATVGRVSAQKDPAFFAATARALRRLRPDVGVVWIGDGDHSSVDSLRANGVEVTGWLGPHEQLARLAACSLYVHTARWESCPMSMVEAARIGLTIVPRSIPALTSLGFPAGVDTPDSLASAVVDALSGAATSVHATATHAFRSDTTPRGQERALLAAYRSITAGRVEVDEPHP